MLQTILKVLLYRVIRLLMFTYKVRYFNVEHRTEAENITKKNGIGYLVPVWHELVFGVMVTHGKHPYLTLSSRSKDGEYAAYISKKLGHIPVRGSSKKGTVEKGGKEAMEIYTQKIQEGLNGGITVDGPKGPRRKVKLGILIIAQKTGAHILPITASYNNCWEFNSWDRFKIPKPFSKIAINYGTVYHLKNAQGDLTEDALLLEEHINRTENIGKEFLKNWI